MSYRISLKVEKRKLGSNEFKESCTIGSVWSWSSSTIRLLSLLNVVGPYEY